MRVVAEATDQSATTNRTGLSVLIFSRVLNIASWLATLSLVILTIVPADERPSIGVEHGFEHFFAFALAGLLVGWAQPRPLRASLFYAVAFSLALELSQIPLPTRHARLEDFIVDAVSACLGISIAYASRYLYREFAAAQLPTR